MKEFWVNVYKAPWNDNGQHIANLDNPHECRLDAMLGSANSVFKTLYRIHVKMKSYFDYDNQQEG